MKKIFFICLCLLCAGACEYEFNVEELNSEKKLFVMSMIGNNKDSVIVDVMYAYPILSPQASYEIPQNVKLDLYCNDVPMNCSRMSITQNGCRYAYKYEIKEGDNFKMQASADGVTANSHCTITSHGLKPEITTRKEVLEHSLIRNIDTVSYVSIKLKDDEPDVENWYMIKVLRTKTDATIGDIWEEKKDTTYISSTEYMMIDRILEQSNDSNIHSLMDYNSSGKVFFISDNTFTDGARTIINDKCLEKYHVNSATTFNEITVIDAFQTFDYVFEISKLSPEAMAYFRAQISIENNELARLGWAPAFFGTGNIEGGYGLFGSTPTWRLEI